MKRILPILLCAMLMLLSACDVHQWPDTPERVSVALRLVYDTDMAVENYLYDGHSVTSAGSGDTYDNTLGSGKIRYIIRAYPTFNAQAAYEEFVFTGDISGGYDRTVTLDLEPGEYDIKVWSDLVTSAGHNDYYDAADFAEIKLIEHQGNTDWRDAYRGISTLSLTADVTLRATDTIDVAMQRPMAKFQFITTDIVEFVAKEAARRAEAALAEANDDDSRSDDSRGDDSRGDDSRSVELSDYTIVLQYVGYMADTYSIFTDKPVDSTVGEQIVTSLTQVSATEASLGFDYLFVNGKDTAVTLRVGVYNQENTLISLSDPITIPIKRGQHSILRGSFMMCDASGGVGINPDYDDEYNIIIP